MKGAAPRRLVMPTGAYTRLAPLSEVPTLQAWEGGTRNDVPAPPPRRAGKKRG